MSGKIYVFDAYGTLFKVNSSIQGLSKKQERVSEKVQELWRIRQLQYTWLSNSMGRWVDFNQITREALDYAMASYGVHDEDFRQSLLDIYKRPSTFRDVLPFLKVCRFKEIRTAILSNGSKDRLVRSLNTTGLTPLIDTVLSVNQVRIFKPSKRVYQMVPDHFHCHPEDIVFFSSNAWDVSGAKNFGFYSIWVNRKGEPFENLGFQPDKEVTSLNDFKPK